MLKICTAANLVYTVSCLWSKSSVGYAVRSSFIQKQTAMVFTDYHDESHLIWKWIFACVTWQIYSCKMQQFQLINFGTALKMYARELKFTDKLLTFHYAHMLFSPQTLNYSKKNICISMSVCYNTKLIYCFLPKELRTKVLYSIIFSVMSHSH